MLLNLLLPRWLTLFRDPMPVTVYGVRSSLRVGHSSKGQIPGDIYLRQVLFNIVFKHSSDPPFSSCSDHGVISCGLCSWRDLLSPLHTHTLCSPSSSAHPCPSIPCPGSLNHPTSVSCARTDPRLIPCNPRWDLPSRHTPEETSRCWVAVSQAP